MGGRDKQTDRDRETERDRQTDKQRHRERDRETERETETDRDRQTGLPYLLDGSSCRRLGCEPGCKPPFGSLRFSRFLGKHKNSL